MIRCYECKHFKPDKRTKGRTGKCMDEKPPIKVDAVDFCDRAVKKEN